MDEFDDNWGRDPAQEPEDGGEHIPDPDDDPSRRASIAARDARVLTTIAAGVSVVLVAVSAALGMLGVPGMDVFTPGLAVGCAVATLNLHILSRVIWGMFETRLGPTLGGFLLSFGTLLTVALLLAAFRESWLIGFGVGLALPGIAGVAFAVFAQRRR